MHNMERYKGSDGESGIIAYESGNDYIRVQFSTGTIYRYTYKSAGSYNIERMKVLARSGGGLNTYINTNIRKMYERKER